MTYSCFDDLSVIVFFEFFKKKMHVKNILIGFYIS